MTKIAVSILLSTLAATAVAQQDVVDRFEKRSQTLDGDTPPDRLFVPADYDSTQAYPVVLALHGAGERGTDNERHIQLHRLATSWADPARQAENPAFVLAPQIPSSRECDPSATDDGGPDWRRLDENDRTRRGQDSVTIDVPGL